MNDSVIGMACPVACDRGWGVLKVCIIDKTVSVSITHLWHRCHRFGGNRLTVAYITTGSVSITTAIIIIYDYVLYHTRILYHTRMVRTIRIYAYGTAIRVWYGLLYHTRMVKSYS